MAISAALLLTLALGAKRLIVQVHSNWLILGSLRRTPRPSFVLGSVQCQPHSAQRQSLSAWPRPHRAAALVSAIGGDCQTAIELLTPSVQLGDRFDTLWLADLYLLQGRRSDAVNALHLVNGGHFPLGRASLPTIKTDNPATLFWADLARESLNSADQLLSLGQLYNEIGRSDLSRLTFEKALLSDNQEKVSYWVILGLLAEAREEPETAIEVYRKGLRHFPDHPKLLERLQRRLAGNRRYPEALGITRRLSIRDPHTSRWYLEAARLAALIGDIEQSREWLTMASRQKDRTEWQFEYLAGDIFCKVGYLSEAFRHYNRALEISSGKPEVLYRLALCQVAAKDYTSAIENLQLADKSQPELNYLSPILDLLGRCYLESGQTQEAIQVWHRLLQLVPTHRNARKQIERLNVTR